MRKEIAQDIKKSYESGKMNASELKDIVENAILKVAESAKDGVVDINDIAKEAIVATVTELKSTGNGTKEHVQAVVSGTIDGISKNSKEIVDDLDMELLKTKYRLWEKKGELSVQLKDALNGAKEAASTFSDETKDDLLGLIIRCPHCSDGRMFIVEILPSVRSIVPKPHIPCRSRPRPQVIDSS